MAVRWQPMAVVAGIAAPPLLLALLVWPSSASAGDGDGGGGNGDGDDIEAELAAGESAEGTVGGTASSDFLVIGDGSVLRIDVAGPGFDPTLTLVDPDSGETLDFNDDANDLDPQLLVELDDGETVVAEVRSLTNEGGSFVISVSPADEDDAGADAGGAVRGTAPPPPAVPGPTLVFPPGPATTIVVEG